MSLNATLIRPGLLVSLKTTVHGGVSYQKRTIVPDHPEGKARIASWETTRQIQDAEEHNAAVVARGKCRTAISRVCCPSSFGLLCPEQNEEDLNAALLEAQRIASEHNAKARFTRLDVFVLTGRIADSDEQAAKAIASEVRDLIAAMERGVRAADPEAIREAASKARALSGMLSEDAKNKVSAAIKEVRAIASDIVRRVEKSGERAADVVVGVKLEALQGARFAVLDFDAQDQAADPLPAAAPRALDLSPVGQAPAAKPEAARQIEFATEV
jgi:hypothetical protein